MTAGVGSSRSLPRSRAETTAGYPVAGPLLTRRLNTMLIAENWEEMLRVAASLKYGHVTASLIVGKLSRADRQNTLAAALKEYGRCVVPSTPPATWPGRTTAARSPASSTRARAC